MTVWWGKCQTIENKIDELSLQKIISKQVKSCLERKKKCVYELFINLHDNDNSFYKFTYPDF